MCFSFPFYKIIIQQFRWIICFVFRQFIHYFNEEEETLFFSFHFNLRIYYNNNNQEKNPVSLFVRKLNCWFFGLKTFFKPKKYQAGKKRDKVFFKFQMLNHHDSWCLFSISFIIIIIILGSEINSFVFLFCFVANFIHSGNVFLSFSFIHSSFFSRRR